MKLRIISIIFAGLLVLAAVGCGGPEMDAVDAACYNCGAINIFDIPQGTPSNGLAASCGTCGYSGYIGNVRLNRTDGGVTELRIIYAY